MKTNELPAAIPPELMADLEDAVADLIRGIRDHVKMDEAARQMDEGREEIRERFGDLDIAGELTDLDDNE